MYAGMVFGLMNALLKCASLWTGCVAIYYHECLGHSSAYPGARNLHVPELPHWVTDALIVIAADICRVHSDFVTLAYRVVL